MFIESVHSIAWTKPYVDAVMESRQCFNTSYMSIIDSLFIHLSDTTLATYYYSRGLSFLGDRIISDREICQSIIETASHIYNDILWDVKEAVNLQYHKEQEIINNMKVISLQESKELRNKARIRYDKTRDSTIHHIQGLLTSNTIKEQCETFKNENADQPSQIHSIKKCIKDKRKQAIMVYTRFRN